MTDQFRNNLLKHLIESNLEKLEKEVKKEDKVDGDRYSRTLRQIAYYSGKKSNEYLNRLYKIRQKYIGY